MSYALVDGALARRAGPVEQRLVAGIAGLSWRGLDSEGAWHEDWPPGDRGRTARRPRDAPGA